MGKLWPGSIILIVAALCANFSCKKSTNEPVTPDSYYYVRFKINGVIKEYKSNTVMNFGKNSAGFYFMSAKVQQSQTEFPLIRFDLSGIKEPLSTLFSYSNSSKDVTAKIYYGENRVDEFVSLPGFGDLKLQITEKTETYVKGTFSGTISETYVYVPLEKKITEGKFYLQAVNQ
jgi:hypothetical protein